MGSNDPGWAIASNHLVYNGTATGVNAGRVFMNMGLTNLMATIVLAEMKGGSPFNFSIGTTTDHMQYSRTDDEIIWQAITIPDLVSRGNENAPGPAIAGSVTIQRAGGTVTITEPNGFTTFTLDGMIPSGTYLGLRATPSAKPVRIKSMTVRP